MARLGLPLGGDETCCFMLLQTCALLTCLTSWKQGGQVEGVKNAYDQEEAVGAPRNITGGNNLVKYLIHLYEPL